MKELLVRLVHSGGGGHLDLLRRGFKQWNIADFDIPTKLKERGVDDPNVVSTISISIQYIVRYSVFYLN